MLGARESKRVGWGVGGDLRWLGVSIKVGSIYAAKFFKASAESRRGAGQHACLPLMRDNFISSVVGVT